MTRHTALLAALALLPAACAPSPGASAPRTPTAPPPVACTDAPSGHQVMVTCRYYQQGQAREVWEQVLDRASLAAIALGFSHVQFLSVELRPEMVRYPTPIECKRTLTGQECEGGQVLEVPASTLAINQFALLSAEEAASRAGDPLIPVERRPVDARQRITSRGVAGGAPPR